MTSLRTILPATVLLLAPACPAPAGPYTFTKVADNAVEYANFSRPRINNNAVVAFQAGMRNGQQILFTVQAGVRTTVEQLPNGPYNSFGGRPHLNDGGAVAFL